MEDDKDENKCWQTDLSWGSFELHVCCCNRCAAARSDLWIFWWQTSNLSTEVCSRETGRTGSTLWRGEHGEGWMRLMDTIHTCAAACASDEEPWDFVLRLSHNVFIFYSHFIFKIHHRLNCSGFKFAIFTCNGDMCLGKWPTKQQQGLTCTHLIII